MKSYVRPLCCKNVGQMILLHLSSFSVLAAMRNLISSILLRHVDVEEWPESCFTTYNIYLYVNYLQFATYSIYLNIHVELSDVSDFFRARDIGVGTPQFYRKE